MNKRLILILVLFLVVCSYLLVGWVVFNCNKEIIKADENEIKSLRSSVKKYKENNERILKLNDSLLLKVDSISILKNQHKSDVIYDTGVQMNGKGLSTKEIIEYVNKIADENNRYKNDIVKYERIIDKLGYKVDKVQNNVVKFAPTDKSPIVEVIHKYDSLKIKYNNLVKQTENLTGEVKSLKKDLSEIDRMYGLNEKNIYGKTTNKVDSALYLYPYFKKKLFKDKNGEWRVKW